MVKRHTVRAAAAQIESTVALAPRPAVVYHRATVPRSWRPPVPWRPRLGGPERLKDGLSAWAALCGAREEAQRREGNNG